MSELYSAAAAPYQLKIAGEESFHESELGNGAAARKAPAGSTSPDPCAAVALSWATIAVIAAVTLGALAVSPAVSSFPFMVAAPTAVLFGYHIWRRPIPKILGGMSGTLQLLLILPFGILLSFAAAASSASFQDSLLHAADRAIGFSWSDYAHWVDQYPWLVLCYNSAYTSFILQPLPLICLLAAAGDVRRLHMFTAAFTLCLLVTCLVFHFVPAVSVYAYLKIPLDSFDHIRPVSTFQHLVFIDQMRAGTLTFINPYEGAGLITFPSFHACGATLLIWGFWGLRQLRIPALLLNLTLIASTPIDGAHYLVDVIAGIVLACAAIAATKALERRAGPMLSRALSQFYHRPELVPAFDPAAATTAESPEARQIAA